MKALAAVCALLLDGFLVWGFVWCFTHHPVASVITLLGVYAVCFFVIWRSIP